MGKAYKIVTMDEKEYNAFKSFKSVYRRRYIDELRKYRTSEDIKHESGRRIYYVSVKKIDGWSNEDYRRAFLCAASTL